LNAEISIMKKPFFILTLLLVFSCGEGNSADEYQKAIAELKAYESLESKEEGTMKFIQDYLSDVNSSDWTTKVPKYLQPNPEAFLREHAVFRESFRNYKATIKHLTVEGNEGIVWITITANYAKAYVFENSDYGDEIIKGIEAKNQPLSWDETWYFNVVDGRFGEKWDFLKDNHKVIKDLKNIE